MINADFSFLNDSNKIAEANKLNKEFERIFMNCDEWNYDDCVYEVILQFGGKLKYLTSEEFHKVCDMF